MPLTTHPYLAEVKEEVEPYLYFPSGLSWPVLGWILPLFLEAAVVIHTHTHAKWPVLQECTRYCLNALHIMTWKSAATLCTLIRSKRQGPSWEIVVTPRVDTFLPSFEILILSQYWQGSPFRVRWISFAPSNFNFKTHFNIIYQSVSKQYKSFLFLQIFCASSNGHLNFSNKSIYG